MIDMNMDIQHIMEQCDRIAFNETKSQATRDLMNGRSRQEARTGAWNGEYNRGEKIKHGEKRYSSPSYSDPNGEDAKNAKDAMKPMRTADDYRNREKMYGKDVDKINASYKSHEKWRKHTGDGHPIGSYIARKDSEKSKMQARAAKGRDTAHESASIFDTLLDQV